MAKKINTLCMKLHTNLDLEGYEDMGGDGEPTGIKLPYVVTVSQAGNKVLSIRRNYNPNDPLKKKIKLLCAI